MYELAILESRQEHVELLEQRIARYRKSSQLSVHAFRAVGDFERFLEGETPVDIVLMSIRLGEDGPNGIDVVEKHFPCGCGTQVIYVTGHIEYCTQVYRTQHQYFIVKPVAQAELDAALDKAMAALVELANRPIAFKVARGRVSVMPKDIVYVESSLRRLLVHTTEETLTTYGTLAAVQRRLPSSFVQCHKSFLVNMDHVAEMRGSRVELLAGDVVPVSHSRSKHVRQALNDHLGRPL